MANLFSNLSHQETKEMMKLSGLHVWPVIIADEAVDRFIFRRPELGYLVALKRVNENREKEGLDPVDCIRIRLFRAYTTQPRKNIKKKSIRKTIGTFHQVINHEDKIADVRLFLENLRGMLKRTMPDRPILNLKVSLVYDDTELKKNCVSSHTMEWL